MYKQNNPQRLEPQADIETEKSLVFGLDLGSISDYSALAVIEATRTISEDGKDEISRLDCVSLKRWALRTPYQQIVQDVVTKINNLDPFETPKQKTLAVDGTGVGVAVVDLFRAEKINADFRAISITGGSTVNRTGDVFFVPKRDLVGCVQLALQNRTLKTSPALVEADTLMSELQNFKATISANGHDSYGAANDWRIGSNDDLVLATAMAIWCASRPPLRVTQQERDLFSSLSGKGY
jgi:hypothetical protein